MHDKEHKTITHIYAVLTVSLLMSFLPMIAASLMAMIMFTGAWIAAYVLRKKADHDSLMTNHMSFIIKTIWIWSLLITIGMTAASFWFYEAGDHRTVQAFMDQLSSGMIPSEAQMNDVLRVYMKDNWSLLINIGSITIGPGMLYFIYRISKGLSRAIKGHRIGNVKSWV